MDARVGRIDGSVPVSQRALILDACRVVILTPDVMHAWLLGNLALKSVRAFVRATRLMIIDEVHTFTGVFGSNAAYLFRRYEHALRTLTRKKLQYVCASATIQDPAAHLTLLTGRTFTLIGPERDGSPRQPVTLHFLRPTEPTRDLLTGAASLLHGLVARQERFLCFSDSRKQTENLAGIMARRPGAGAPEDAEGPPQGSTLANLRVLPYRSGYEARDRADIQARLTRGDLDGIISTSALELGMDIPHLDAVVLLGVPASSTSFQQRIGRVGRRRPGRVLILDSGSASDALLFERPEQVLARPLADGALYLENQNIQCIHATCLARTGGEHDALMTALGRDTDAEFVTPTLVARRVPRSGGPRTLRHAAVIAACPARPGGRPPQPRLPAAGRGDQLQSGAAPGRRPPGARHALVRPGDARGLPGRHLPLRHAGVPRDAHQPAVAHRPRPPRAALLHPAQLPAHAGLPELRRGQRVTRRSSTVGCRPWTAT